MKKFLLIALSLALAVAMCSCCCTSFVEGFLSVFEEETDYVDNMFADGLLCVKSNGKYGYVNAEGDFVIDATYDAALPFYNGTAIVMNDEDVCIIDTEGKVLDSFDNTTDVFCVPQYYTILVRFLYGAKVEFDESLTPYKAKSGKYGYKNAEGDLVIPAQFEEAMPFQADNGLAIVKSSGMYAVIDQSGSFVVEPIYSSIGLFIDGVATVQGKKGRAFIDTEGNVLGNRWYEDIESFSNGLAAVKIDDQWGYIDTEGKWAIQPQFSEAWDFTEDGAAIVLLDGKYGYINKEGKYIVAPKYDRARDFSEGNAAVRYDDKWYFIDLNGEKISFYNFDSVGDFKNGAAWVEDDDQYGFINASGSYIASPQFKDVEDFGKNGLAPVLTEDNKYGYINLSGDGVIQPTFDGEKTSSYYASDYILPDQSHFYDDGYAVGHKDGKYGVINEDGVYVIGPRFEQIITWDSLV